MRAVATFGRMLPRGVLSPRFEKDRERVNYWMSASQLKLHQYVPGQIIIGKFANQFLGHLDDRPMVTIAGARAPAASARTPGRGCVHLLNRPPFASDLMVTAKAISIFCYGTPDKRVQYSTNSKLQTTPGCLSSGTDHSLLRATVPSARPCGPWRDKRLGQRETRKCWCGCTFFYPSF